MGRGVEECAARSRERDGQVRIGGGALLWLHVCDRLLPLSVFSDVVSQPKDEVARMFHVRMSKIANWTATHRFSAECSTKSKYSSKSLRPSGGRCFPSEGENGRRDQFYDVMDTVKVH